MGPYNIFIYQNPAHATRNMYAALDIIEHKKQNNNNNQNNTTNHHFTLDDKLKNGCWLYIVLKVFVIKQSNSLRLFEK
eukprot:UN07397